MLLIAGPVVEAGGGVVLRDDTCIITIGFYEAHFTAYQPETRGDREYCEDLPDAAPVLIVLDYLHGSLQQVPVDLRIIRNVTGKGEFARANDIAALGPLDPHTVFYQPPRVEAGGRFMVELSIEEEGDYIGIVTAGHPSNAQIYTSVFPFTVGQSRVPWPFLGFIAAVLIAGHFLRRMQRMGGGP